MLSTVNGGTSQVFGDKGALTLRGANVALSGSGNTVSFDSHYSNGTVTETGASGGNSYLFGAGLGGVYTLSGLASTDVLTFSKADFASFQALQASGALVENGTDTVVTVGADKVTVLGQTLAASQFAFV